MPPVEEGVLYRYPAVTCPASERRSSTAIDRFWVFWKTFVNWEIEGGGSPLWLAPRVLVRLSKPVRFIISSEPLQSCRCLPACGRALRLAGSWRASTAPVLPLIIGWRWGRVCWAKRRNRRMLLAVAA